MLFVMALVDVAKRAGVSIATVSRVLNNEPGVRPETVRHVQRALRAAAYDPEAVRRGPRPGKRDGKKTRSIAVLVLGQTQEEWFRRPLFSAVVGGINRAANDRDLGFPIYRKAAELGIPVMIHQAGSTRIDAKLELGRPALLDDIGREFRDLRVIIAHCGIPWVDEALFLLTKHPHFYGELSYLIATLTRRDLFLLLHRCEPAFVPLEKIFFGTDYPGFLYDPVKLAGKLMTVNEEAAALSLPPIPEHKLRGIMGDNVAAVLGIEA